MDKPVDPNIRLRIAARIHFALLRQYDENIAVATLLEGGPEAREALWVCEASGKEDLMALARQFHAAPLEMRAMPEVRKTGLEPQDMPWAADTSGFGVPQWSSGAASAKPSRWFSASRWLRGAAA